MKAESWLGMLLVAALPLAACEPAADDAAQQPGAEEVPTLTEQPTADEPGAVMQQAVTVENPMPHTMVVYRVEGGERTELGSVDAESEETFTVEGMQGDTVALVAQDEAETHEVEQTAVVAGDTTSWTLGG